jgi:RhoGAP domain
LASFQWEDTKYDASLFCRVAANADTNKMNIQNLSLIFTPAIFHDHNQAQTPGEWFSDCVLEDLILNYEKLFSTVDPAALNNTVAVEDQRRLMEHENARKFATAPARGYGKESSLGGSTMQGGPSLPPSGKTQPPPAPSQQAAPPPPPPSNFTQPPQLPTIPKNSPFMENANMRTTDTQSESNRFAEAIATANALHSQRNSPVPSMTNLGGSEQKTPPTRPTIHTKLSTSSLSSPQPFQFKPLPAAASPVRTSSRASLMQVPPQQLQQVRSAPSTPAAAFEYEPMGPGPSDTLNDSYHSPLGSWLDEEVEEPKEESKEKRISFNAIKRTMSLRKSTVLKSSEPPSAKRSDSLPMDN